MSNPVLHKHRDIALHSPEQQRKFFACGRELGHNPHDLKESAKKHFNVTCFNQLTVSNMIYLIDWLEKQREVRERMAPGLNSPKPTQLIMDEYDPETWARLSDEEKAQIRKEQAERANEEMLKKL